VGARAQSGRARGRTVGLRARGHGAGSRARGGHRQCRRGAPSWNGGTAHTEEDGRRHRLGCTPTVGPHKLLGCINRGAAMRFFISAIPATESVETWLISVSVCCLLLRLKALVCCSDFFGGARAAVRRWQNGSVAEPVNGRTVRVRLLLLT
jgi:hypothetical protein